VGDTPRGLRPRPPPAVGAARAAAGNLRRLRLPSFNPALARRPGHPGASARLRQRASRLFPRRGTPVRPRPRPSSQAAEPPTSAVVATTAKIATVTERKSCAVPSIETSGGAVPARSRKPRVTAAWISPGSRNREHQVLHWAVARSPRRNDVIAAGRTRRGRRGASGLEAGQRDAHLVGHAQGAPGRPVNVDMDEPAGRGRQLRLPEESKPVDDA